MQQCQAISRWIDADIRDNLLNSCRCSHTQNHQHQQIFYGQLFFVVKGENISDKQWQSCREELLLLILKVMWLVDVATIMMINLHLVTLADLKNSFSHRRHFIRDIQSSSLQTVQEITFHCTIYKLPSLNTDERKADVHQVVLMSTPMMMTMCVLVTVIMCHVPIKVKFATKHTVFAHSLQYFAKSSVSCSLRSFHSQSETDPTHKWTIIDQQTQLVEDVWVWTSVWWGSPGWAQVLVRQLHQWSGHRQLHAPRHRCPRSVGTRR